MKIVGLSGSKVGTKTKIALNYTINELMKQQADAQVTLIDLADFDVVFSDGRDIRDYQGDTKVVLETLMDADAIIIATPIFQASIPAPLKNIFDLLPEKAFADKIVSMVVTAGSPKHFLVIEQQLKPILSYMNAQIVQKYVFIEEKDFYRHEIINDEILFRIQRLVEDTILLTQVTTSVLKAKEASYDF